MGESSRADRLLRWASFCLLGWGLLHIAGGLYNVALQIHGSLLASLGSLPSDLSGAPRLASIALAVSAVWSGCIIGLGVEAVWLALGPFARGRRWAWVLTALTLGPADTGASALGLIARPPFPYPIVLPLGVCLFLGSLILALPAVWLHTRNGS